MAFRNSLHAATWLILCVANWARAEAPNRPIPVADPSETTVVDGGLGVAPPIALPRVESVPTSNAAAELSLPFASITNAHQPNHLAGRLFKISFGSAITSSDSSSSTDKPGSTKLGLKGLLIHKTKSSVEPTQ